MVEIWKPIKGYEDLYEVSNYGRVRSLDRNVTQKNGKRMFYPGKYLKYDIITRKHTNYHRVILSKEHKIKRYSIHRLVAEAFIPNPENKPHINHIDNNGENNRVNNLEWVTHSENMIHAQKQGRLFKTQSKAGKIAGKKAKEKVIKNYSKYIGNIYLDKYKVIWFKYNTKPKKPKFIIQCLKCGLYKTISANYFKNNILTKQYKLRCNCQD